MTESYSYDELRAAYRIVMDRSGEASLTEFDRAALLLAQYTKASLDLHDEVSKLPPLSG